MYQQNYGYFQQPQQQPRTSVYLKGRPVSSIEEVRATPVDFDGSVSYFPDLAHNKVFTKQINLDGTSSIQMYELKEISPTSQEDYVSKTEFMSAFESLVKEIEMIKGGGQVTDGQQQSTVPAIQF